MAPHARRWAPVPHPQKKPARGCPLYGCNSQSSGALYPMLDGQDEPPSALPEKTALSQRRQIPAQGREAAAPHRFTGQEVQRLVDAAVANQEIESEAAMQHRIAQAV
jgi:hypothetical protein